MKAGCAGEDTPKCLFPGIAGFVETKSNQTDKTIKDAMEIDEKKDSEGVASPQKSETEKKHIQYTFGDTKIGVPRSNMEMKSPMKEGCGKYKDIELG